MIRSLETFVTFDSGEALMLEASLIRRKQPPFNVKLKDDSTHYPYLCITWSKPYPEFYVTSHKFISRKNLQLKNKHVHNNNIANANNANDSSSSSSNVWPTEDVYLGPFVEGNSLKSLLSLVKEIFPLRQRWYPLYHDRTCLNYDIGRCPGVCQKLIKPNEYRQTVGEASYIFDGRSHLMLDKLETRLKNAISREAFELAETISNQVYISIYIGIFCLFLFLMFIYLFIY